MIRSWEDPVQETGHIQIMRGGLAPDGSVGKITGKEGYLFTGPARAVRLRGRHARRGRATSRSARAMWS